MPEAAVILLAAGRGTRMAAAAPDKVWADLGGIPVLGHSLRAFDATPHIATIVVVTRIEMMIDVRRLAADLGIRTTHIVVEGGASRQESTRRGIEALVGLDVDVVLVHDAARPLVDEATIATATTLARKHGAAIPGLPVADTIKRVRGGTIVETPLRSELFAAQTPQAFQIEILRRAHAFIGDDANDDAALVERIGHPVRVFPGSRRNLKITIADDLVLARALLTT